MKLNSFQLFVAGALALILGYIARQDAEGWFDWLLTLGFFVSSVCFILGSIIEGFREGRKERERVGRRPFR